MEPIIIINSTGLTQEQLAGYFIHLSPEDREKAIDTIKRNTVQEEIKPVKPKGISTSDHQPCIECGGIDFMRTGTCYACTTCGASQGCS